MKSASATTKHHLNGTKRLRIMSLFSKRQLNTLLFFKSVYFGMGKKREGGVVKYNYVFFNKPKIYGLTHGLF